MLARNDPQRLLDAALNALGTGGRCQAKLDELPVPVYATDAEGAVTFWNHACVEFAGREPELGRDRWCVSWHLYTTAGEPLAHEDCPMAQAIRQQEPIRDVIAIAERPDGTRVAFKPYPTPLFDRDGVLVGAINMLIDVSEEESEALHKEAERCRRLADATYDRATSKILEKMATGFDKIAGDLVGNRRR